MRSLEKTAQLLKRGESWACTCVQYTARAARLCVNAIDSSRTPLAVHLTCSAWAQLYSDRSSLCDSSFDRTSTMRQRDGDNPRTAKPVAFLACALVASTRAGYDDQEVYAPQPYQFGYETQDEYGNRQSRHEQDAGDGVKTGMYGFRDAAGLFRQVQYVADHRGFRAWVKTNEPGTQDSAPASARIESQQPPAAHIASAASAAPHQYRLVAPQQAQHLATVAATPSFVAAAPTFVAAPLRKVPVHHSLYPIGEISARHGPIQQAYSQQKVRRRKPAEFFKKSIINKQRPKSQGPRVRVVQATKDGGYRTIELPVYKD
ncbi:hypothetical protein HPB51_018008 [Rhipicephalus microplus]|uniref:Cuticle protein n=1 Tax=Rhipicephalus microplus TaxID=6941 RepID=A0A9J6D604_RHIMP|nr:hypothetical protein HPB51_018008 [Rhipicephalus microplus]